MTGLPYLDADGTGLDAAFALDPAGLSVEARKGRVVLRGAALGADVEGAFAGHLAVTLASVPIVSGHVAWDGSVGMVHETARGSIEDGRLDAMLDVREISPEAIRSLWPASPVTETGTAHLEAHGSLEAIELEAAAGLDGATANIRGALSWGGKKTAKLHLVADGVDIRQFAAAAGASRLGVTGDVDIALGTERVDGAVDLDSVGGHVGAYSVPRTTLRASGFRIAGGAFGGDATIVVHEPGAPTTITLHAVPRAQSSRVDFTVLSQAVRLAALRRLPEAASGNIRVNGKGTVDLDSLAFDVALDAEGDRLRQGSLRIGSVALRARGHGNLPDSAVDLVLHARDVAWEATTLSKLDLTVRGPLLSPHATIRGRGGDVPDVDADLDVEVLAGPALRRAHLRLARGGATAHVGADLARFAHGGVTVDGVVIGGLGAPATASFALLGNTLRLHAKAPRLEIVPIARLFGLDDLVHGGALEIEADVTADRHGGTGLAAVRLDHAIVGGVHEISAHLDAHLSGRQLVGTVGASAKDLGFFGIEAKDLVLGGSEALATSSWQKAWGDIRLEGHVDLEKVAERLPAGWLPFSALRGTIDLEGRLERDSMSDFTPLVELVATTSNLLVRGKAWALEGVDTSISVHVNGETGFLDLAANVRDAKGDLATLAATSDAIPFKAIWDAPASTFRLLPGLPFDAHLTVPRRPLASWPSSLRLPPLDGDLEVDLDFKGALLTPHIVGTAKIARVGSAFARLTLPLEVNLQATYDGERADVDLHAHQQSLEVLAGEAHAVVPVGDLVAGTDPLPWKASARAHMNQFPLATVGPLNDRHVGGRVSGDVRVDDLHADGRAQASFSVSSLKIGDAAYRSATAAFHADGKRIDAEVRVDQDDGFGSAKASVDATWGASLLPVADASHSLALSLQAKHFRAAVLLPFVRGGVDKLDGFVDADAYATVEPHSRSVHVQGSATLSGGLLEVAAFGGELHDITAKVTVTPDGLLTLERMTASGTSGQVLASASARLDGLRVDAASATILIPKSHPLPLSIGGSQLAMIDGTLDLTESVSADSQTTDVKVDVPTLHLLLPETGSQDVQVLGRMRGITIGTHLHPGGEFVPDVSDPEDNGATAARPAGATQLRVETHLGEDVFIRRGANLRVQLTGGPTVTVAEKTVVSGEIQLPRGVLNLYGKTFDIEHGTVTFVGDDASNPQVSVTAGWIAPDGTQVKADFLGPLKTGKVTLRAEPPLARNDIVQLLLFGTTEGQAAAAQGAPGTSSAEGVAGNVATQPLNRALDQFGLSAVSAKVDTSASVAKPEVEVQIARDVSVQLAHILYLGPPPPGSSPDTTLLTADWRFLRKWSLEGTVGNAGSTILDLVWQHRY